MSYFIVEHKRKENYVMETLVSAEDIDTSIYETVLGVWICESMAEVQIMQNELPRLRNARSS
jgi:hypothetical protein